MKRVVCWDCGTEYAADDYVFCKACRKLNDQRNQRRLVGLQALLNEVDEEEKTPARVRIRLTG